MNSLIKKPGVLIIGIFAVGFVGITNCNALSKNPPDVAIAAGSLNLFDTPVRFIDTRNGTGGPGGAYSNGSVRMYNFWRSGVPSGAKGILGNIVAVTPSGIGNFQLNTTNSFPPGSTAILNLILNQDLGNSFTAALDSSGNLWFRATVNGGGSVHLVIDIYGYYQ